MEKDKKEKKSEIEILAEHLKKLGYEIIGYEQHSSGSKIEIVKTS